MAWSESGLGVGLAWTAFCGLALLMPQAGFGQPIPPQSPEAEVESSSAAENAPAVSPQVEGNVVIPPPSGIATSRKPPTKGFREPETNVVPSLRVSERYDSNVFFVQGSNLADYVTTISPQLKVNHRRELVDASISGGVTAEVYAKNPGLNYVAANALIDLNLDRAMNELVRGLGLRLSNTFYYTPQTPSFAAPAGGGQIPDSFVRGLQAQRANSRTNAARVEGSYSIAPNLDLVSTYKDQRIQFGNVIPTPEGVVNAGFIDTTFQTVTSGPVFRPSQLDTITLEHLYQKGTFKFGGPSSSFSTQGAMAGWTRSLTPTLTASVEGGVAILSIGNDLQPLAAASLRWRSRDTSAVLSYSRVIVPSFLFVATPLLSQVVNATVTHQVTRSLSVSLNGSYGKNESIPDRSLLQFESYSATPSISYTIGRDVTAMLSYTHSQFTQNFAAQEFRFDRNVVLLSLYAEWK